MVPCRAALAAAWANALPLARLRSTTPTNSKYVNVLLFIYSPLKQLSCSDSLIPLRSADAPIALYSTSTELEDAGPRGRVVQNHETRPIGSERLSDSTLVSATEDDAGQLPINRTQLPEIEPRSINEHCNLCAIYLPLRQLDKLLIQNNLASLMDWICAKYRNRYREYTGIHIREDLRDSLCLASLQASSANGTRRYVAGIVVGTRTCVRRRMVS